MSQVTLPQPYLASQDNLIDWYFSNCEDVAALSFLQDFQVTNATNDISVYPFLGCSSVEFLPSLFKLDLIINKELDKYYIYIKRDGLIDKIKDWFMDRC